MDFKLLYPERRVVSERQIKTWYSDAVANDEVDDKTCTDVIDMAKELSSAGIITLGR